MSIEQTQRTINQLIREIATLEKQLADVTKKEADKNNKIGTLEQSITKNTTAVTVRMKRRNIEGYQKEVTKLLKDKANILNKISEKRKRLSNATLKLNREEAVQANNQLKQQEKINATYNQQIFELTKQLEEQTTLPKKPQNIFNSEAEEEFDVFISHAAEDKASFCNEFCDILQNKYGLTVWYDTVSIKWGDSIRTEIDKGLKKSKFGVVVLSRNYIRKYWTNYELEALFQKESNDGKVILPIWHDISKKEIQDFSPTLAGKLAMNTGTMLPEEIAEKLSDLL